LLTPAFHGLASERPNPSARPGWPSGQTLAGQRPHKGAYKRRWRCGIPVGLYGHAGTKIELTGDSVGAHRGGRSGAGGGWCRRRHGRERAASRGGDVSRGGATCLGFARQ
jgi:hypothetical protein